MKTLRFCLLALLAVPVLFSACKKDDDEDKNPSGSCKATKAYLYDPQSGTIEDSVIYTYTGDQLTRFDIPGSGYVLLEYTNNKVTKRTGYDYSSPNVSMGHEVIAYNPDGTLQKIDFFTGNPGATRYRTATVSYSGGKYDRVLVTEDTGTGIFVPVEEYIYTYTGNNITGVVAKDLTATPAQSYNYTYAYDNNANYFLKQNPQFMFTDPFFGEFDGTLLPMLVSANNATTISFMGMPIAQFNYDLDAKGNLIKLRFGGDPLIGYSFQCP